MLCGMKGYPKGIVRLGFKLGWPIMNLGKKLNGLPVFKGFINPFFAHPHNQLTAIPIHTLAVDEETRTGNMVLPIKVVERLLERAAHIMILDECHCRSHMGKEPKNIGCIVLGKAVLSFHPSNGRLVRVGEAQAHVKKAAEAGLVANIAHVWIDPVGFGVMNFGQMVFICFCGHDACLYTDYLKQRCPNLEKAYVRLPGLHTEIDLEKCDGCALCAEQCFVAAITMESDKAVITEACKACGRCISQCPRGAIRLHMDGEEKVFQQLLERVSAVADITG